MRAAPSTGTSAAAPGYGVAAPNRAQANTTRPSPTSPDPAATTPGSRAHQRLLSATSPPAASCQAREGREKNAHGGNVVVQWSSTTNEATATTASTARYGVTDRGRSATRR